MSPLEAVIPGIVGLVLVMRPESMFIGAKVEPTEARLRLLRRLGWFLLAIAGFFLAIALI